MYTMTAVTHERVCAAWLRVLLALGAIGLAGCAAHRQEPRAWPAGPMESAAPGPWSSTDTATVGSDREGPDRRSARRALNVEAWDPVLAAALRRVDEALTPVHHRQVARRYRALGIDDAAFDHLSSALELNARDASAWDARARIWRDWGYAALGLGDAYRAVYYSASSPIVHNTLGTFLHAVGWEREARQAFSRALRLDPRASYAMSNLCYLEALARTDAAFPMCRAAVGLDSQSGTAWNNLALAYASHGLWDAAERQFRMSSNPAGIHYNMGVIYLAGGRYQKALESFEAAQAQRPGRAMDRQRVEEARALTRAPDRRASGHDDDRDR